MAQFISFSAIRLSQISPIEHINVLCVCSVRIVYSVLFVWRVPCSISSIYLSDSTGISFRHCDYATFRFRLTEMSVLLTRQEQQPKVSFYCLCRVDLMDFNLFAYP